MPRRVSAVAVLALAAACSGGAPTGLPQPGAPAQTGLPSAQQAAGAGQKRSHAVEYILTEVMYSPASVGVDQTTKMFVGLSNTLYPNTLTDLSFKLTLPGGVFTVASNASTANTCGGTLTATPGAGTISLSGGTLGVGAQCTIEVPILSGTTGAFSLSMPSGTVTTAQQITNAAPSPNPPIDVNPPAALPTAHLYVPVPDRNTVAAYATNSTSTAPAYVFSDSTLSSPNIVAASPYGGNVFVYSSATNRISEFALSNGALASPPVATVTPPYFVNGMTVDEFGRLVVVTVQSGVAGAYWYNGVLKQVGKILSPASQSWQTVTSSGPSVFVGDLTGHQIVEYASNGAPPNNNESPLCSWSVASLSKNPYDTLNAVYDPFYIAFAGTYGGIWAPAQTYIDVAIGHPLDKRVGTETELFYFGELATMEACNASGAGIEEAQPPGGNDLTYITGLAVNPSVQTAAVSTVPNYNETQVQAQRNASVPVWPSILSGTTVNGTPSYTFVNSGVAGGYYLGQPSYGP